MKPLQNIIFGDTLSRIVGPLYIKWNSASYRYYSPFRTESGRHGSLQVWRIQVFW